MRTDETLVKRLVCQMNERAILRRGVRRYDMFGDVASGIVGWTGMGIVVRAITHFPLVLS